VEVAGITAAPTEEWMKQMARNVTMEGCGALVDCRYLLHDRDTKYTASFLAIIKSGQKAPATTRAKPEFECLLRTLDTIGKGGLSVKGYSLW
jgi:putative transposase